MLSSKKLLLMALVCVAGCFRPTFEPQGALLPPQEASVVCQKIASQGQRIESLRVLADATISHGSEKLAFRYVVLSKELSKFRIDVLPPQGAFTLGLLVADEHGAVWMNPQEKTFVRASDERTLVGEYLGLPGISRGTAVALMSGVLPPSVCADVRLFEMQNKDLLFVDDTSHTAWRVEGRTPKLRELQILDSDGTSVDVRATYEAFISARPSRINLDVFSPATAQVSLAIIKSVINPSLNEQLFSVEPPAGYVAER